MPKFFPENLLPDQTGLVAVGGVLESEVLIEAYELGIFPWPIGENLPLTWFSPDPRGVLFCEEFHLGQSLKKTLKKNNYSIHYNRHFSEIIELCEKRHQEKGTWITTEIKNAYRKLFDKGYAYSVEVDYDGILAGGLYGVNLGYFLSAESMFFIRDNASKLALFHLTQKLLKKKISFIDIQMLTPITKTLGGRLIKREDFLNLISENQKFLSLPQKMTPNDFIFLQDE